MNEKDRLLEEVAKLIALVRWILALYAIIRLSGYLGKVAPEVLARWAKRRRRREPPRIDPTKVP
jgi:hypothetical protein